MSRPREERRREAPRGRFITVEGGEGAGKSTQVARLCEALRARGRAVLATREPGGSPGAEAIRELLLGTEPAGWDAMTEALLHFAARRDHVERTIRPALARGTWVVSDRFADSTLAYQGEALGLGRETVRRLQRIVLGAFAPDLTVILDVPVTVGLARTRARGVENRYEQMGIAFHEHLRAAFREIARAEPRRCVVVDAAAAAETVHAAILAALEHRLESPRNG